MSTLVTGDTLEEALSRGRGVERPFRCHVHQDTSPSASVNVLKGLWVCYACGASGAVDSKTPPKAEDLISLLEPERTARVMPVAYNQLFADAAENYWHTRLAPYVVHALGMGTDPITGFATFPVHLADGRFAGVGYRDDDPGAVRRFIYPAGWSASHALFGAAGQYHREEILALTEGASDAAAIQETGCFALATYGSGIKRPQIEMIARFSPRLVLIGFDMDTAGETATKAAFAQLSRVAHTIVRVRWPTKDANATPVSQRRSVLLSAVRSSGYGGDPAANWDARVTDLKITYEQHLEVQRVTT